VEFAHWQVNENIICKTFNKLHLKGVNIIKKILDNSDDEDGLDSECSDFMENNFGMLLSVEGNDSPVEVLKVTTSLF